MRTGGTKKEEDKGLLHGKIVTIARTFHNFFGAAPVYFLNAEKFFVHFQDNHETVVILDYDEEASTYFKLTAFGAEVVRYITNNPNCSRDALVSHLQTVYEGSSTDIATELDKVVEKLRENQILSV